MEKITLANNVINSICDELTEEGTYCKEVEVDGLVLGLKVDIEEEGYTERETGAYVATRRDADIEVEYAFVKNGDEDDIDVEITNVSDIEKALREV